MAKGHITVEVIKTGIKDGQIRDAGQRGKYLYFSRIVKVILPADSPTGEIMRLYACGYKKDEENSAFCDNLIYPDEMNERAFRALNPHMNASDANRLRLGMMFLNIDVIYVNPEMFLPNASLAEGTCV